MRAGSKQSEETRAKMRESWKLRAPREKSGPQSAEHRAAISASLIGKPRLAPGEGERRTKVRRRCKMMLRRLLAGAKDQKNSMARQLGYTRDELIAHLGPRTAGDQIDHYVPVSMFFNSGIYDPAIINALPGLQLLSAEANRAKGTKEAVDAGFIFAECIEFAKQRRSAALTKAPDGYKSGL